MVKKYCTNREMSDPNHIHRKRQDFLALQNAFRQMEWGSAYLPADCFEQMQCIRIALDCMKEPLKIWQPEKPEFILITRKAK